MKMPSPLRMAVALVLLIATTAVGNDQTWGDLEGRFVYNGELPKPKAIQVTQDKDAFADPILDESVVVNPDNRGLANVLVYLLPRKEEAIPVHPSYKETAKAKIELSMRQGRFEPHVLLLRTTQAMTQKNRDSVGYNARIAFYENQPL